MTTQEYQLEAARTLPRLGFNKDVRHMQMGVKTELGELLDAFKKHYIYGKPLDKVNLLEEAGDVLWYIAGDYTINDEAFVIYKPDFKIKSTEEVVDRLMKAMSIDYIPEVTSTIVALCEYLVFDIENVMEVNIAKLRARSDKQFNAEKFLNRDLDNEREILEKGVSVEKVVFAIGDKVTYTDKFSKTTKGIVKALDSNKVFVVFNCGEDWDNYQEYTSEACKTSDLKLGWEEDEEETFTWHEPNQPFH